ncbi:MAG: two-component sensor kinase [Candidatus Scalindua rubra]|uniref:histidine kinase n=1 Tax=Candidatus Scalindua rubra TaxID=1872076 RepID=A0A1E3XCW6_9BACT|nr:MAG: two-component sensor kinase [Candidatus Scalindua rubra]
MSIKKKILFWFLLPSILIATVTAAFSYYHTQKTVNQNIFNQLKIAANELQERLHAYLEGKRVRNVDFSSDGFIRDCTEEINEKESRREYYTTILNTHLITNKKSLHPNILEVFILDFNGKVIASTVESRIGEDVSGEEYFLEAEPLSAFAGGPHYDTYLNSIVIDFSTALLSKVKREPIGIIVNRITIEQRSDKNQAGISIHQDSERNYSQLIAVNKARIMDFSSDGFIRDCTEEINKREDRVRYYTTALNTHLAVNKRPLPPDILEVFIVDFNGKVISSTEIGQIGQDISDEVYFSKVMKRGSCISDLHYSPEFKQYTFEVARLLLSKKEQNPIGILVNRYNGNSLRKITRSGISQEFGQGKRLEGLGETGEVYIVNRDKLMITESRFIENAIFNQVVDTEGVRAAFDNGVGMIGIYSDYRGIPILGVSRYIEEMDWVVLAEKDVSEAFAPIAYLRNVTIIIGSIGIMVIITIAIFISTGITKPIQKLVKGTRRIAKGDLALKIATNSKDEIGSLATSFNDMTTQLEESKRQLQDYAHNLEEKVEDKIGEIKGAKEYTDNLIETAQDAIISIYEDGIINVWNESAEKVFGYSKSDIIGQPVSTIISEKYRKQHQEGLKRFLKTRKPVIIGKTIEISGLTKEGTEIPIEMSLSCQKIKNKRYTFTAIIRDITEKKKVEAERKRMLDELRYRNKEMEQIVYVASHDLRSPLVNIQGFSKELQQSFEKVRPILKDNGVSSAVKKRLDPILEEDIPEALKYILTSTTKIDSLLSGILRLSRMGRAGLTIKRLDMNKLMSDVVGTLEYKIKEVGATLHVDELPSCSGDETQINQVFSNLLDNALKYLNPNRPGIIRISGTRHLVYCVKDNGIGIAAEHQDKIFEIFHRLKPDDSTGEGLGLTIVRRILDRHGGKIWVESKPGKGSKFFVSLPG